MKLSTVCGAVRTDGSPDEGRQSLSWVFTCVALMAWIGFSP